MAMGKEEARSCQSPEGVILAGVQHGEAWCVSPLHQLPIKPPVHLPTETPHCDKGKTQHPDAYAGSTSP